MKTQFLLAAGLLSATLLSPLAVRADDNMFPPAEAAKTFVNFDGKGFLINGQRTFIVSGSLHYPRVPRALWRDRLLRMKRAGFNCVQTYVFWNYHEPKENQFDFAGEKDLDAFLKLVHEMGMYATVRPGPYVCAEWDSGGYPVWLRFKPGVKVRQENAEFEKYVDRYMDKVLPIIAANQINRGGSVIMVQLENEHPQGWGTAMPNNYFRHLRDKALAAGIEVPYFFSGLHHGSDPAGNNPWDSKGRTTPWYTTEFWPGWYNLYGPLDAGGLRRFDRGTWKILAYGGNGYNYYMLHGGTNFESWNNQEDASSYDYGGAIGQAGDLRPIYYRFKRATWFARSFQEILETSENATNDYKEAVSNPKIRVTARKSPAGTIVFLDNSTGETQNTSIKIEGVTYPVAPLAPGEIAPVVLNAEIAPNVKINLCTLRILGLAKQGAYTTIVTYGPLGKSGTLILDKTTNTATEQGHEVSTVTPEITNDACACGQGADLPALKVHYIALSTELADRTWFVDKGKDTYVVHGPRYLGDFDGDTMMGERGAGPDEMLEKATVVVPPGKADFPLLRYLKPSLPNTEVLFPVWNLENWQMRLAGETAPNFNDTNWLQSVMPLPMGADGDYGAEAWYRTTLKAPAAGDYNLRFSGARDWLGAWLNGQRVTVSGNGARTAKVTLQPGDNTLAVLTSHSGRDKLFSYLGAIDKTDAKGIYGVVTLTQGDTPAPTGPAITWHWKAGGPNDSLQSPNEKIDADPIAKPGEDTFNHKPGTQWFRAMLPDIAGPNRTLHFESVDDKAVVYLNGKKLMEHEGWDEAFDVPLDAAWKAGGPNLVAVLVTNNDGAGGMGATALQTGVANKDAVSGWKMRGGLGDPEAGPWSPVAPTNGTPAFYHATFNGDPSDKPGPHPIRRATTTGLSRGFIWLNGHNLGRFPEKVPVEGLYLPEPWIKDGVNSLVIFDEEGKSPANVKITVEAGASRVSVPLTTVK